jgi:GNAT superfamily N-acetyltransferase
VCTDPRWRGRGAASSLTRLVQEKADSDGLPVYLESTMNAVELYRGLGFVPLDGFRMAIPKRGSTLPSELYEEVCMLWLPGSAGEWMSVGGGHPSAEWQAIRIADT